jgi:hypothetical protein
MFPQKNYNAVANVIDFEIKTTFHRGINIKDFPYSIDHDISPFSEEWEKLCKWCIEKAEKRGEGWVWKVSSTILFKNKEHATEFALAWSGK